MKDRDKRILGILSVVFIMFIVLLFFVFFSINKLKDSDEGTVSISNDGKIGVIELEGVIIKSREFVENLMIAEKDKNISAIIVRVNSPGGAVGPVQEIYQEIIRIDKKKPVYASFGTIAASGGYYVGAAARKIFTNPGTITGSIGVVMEFVDLSRLYDLAKIHPTIIKSGKFKDVGHPARKITNEEQDLLSGLISNVHKQFVRDILKRRKEKIKGNIEELAQGQIFSGESAYESGLVDDLASLWEAGRKIHKELKIKGEFGFKYIKKRKKLSFWQIVDNFQQVFSDINWKLFADKFPMILYNP